MSESAHLIYFDGRGRAEIIRILLTAVGIKFTEKNLKKRQEFLDLRPSLVFGQVPVLKIGDKSLTQSGAIVRSLARKGGLYGKYEEEMQLVDSYYEGTRDFLSPFVGIGFAYGFSEVAEKTKAAVEKYLPVFDKILHENSGYLVGASFTMADLGLLEVLLAVRDYHGNEAFAAFEGIKKFFSRISGEKFYQTYISEVRKPPNNESYVATVRETLAF